MLSPTSEVLVNCDGLGLNLKALLPALSTRPLRKGSELIKGQPISESPGNLKADAILLQYFLFKTALAPYSPWKGLLKDVAVLAVPLSFEFWLLGRSYAQDVGKPQVSFSCCLGGNPWSDWRKWTLPFSSGAQFVQHLPAALYTWFSSRRHSV